MKKRFHLAVVLVACASLVLAGCGSDKKIGDGVGADGEGGGAGALRDTTTTTAKAAVTTAPPAAAATSAPPTTRPTPTTRPAPVIKATEVSINSDTSGKQQFEPSQFPVPQGGIVRVTNNDPAEPRGIESSAGKFQPTPLIQPGQTYEWKITLAPGTYACQDSTRPYATCVMKVLPKP